MDHIKAFERTGVHVLNFKITSEEMRNDVAFSGIKVYLFCDGVKDEFVSIFHTLVLFLGGLSDHPHLPWIGSHTPPYQERANIKFLRETMGLELAERDVTHVNIPADYI